MQKDAAYYIDQLKLEPHPEGGYFREYYRSSNTIPAFALPEGYAAARNCATSIYFLLESKDFSAFHRLKSDELWAFHLGSSLSLHLINSEAEHKHIVLGSDLAQGQSLQALIPAGSPFATACDHNDSFTLLSCYVSPGFDYEDFELLRAEGLEEHYPQHADLIKRYCRD